MLGDLNNLYTRLDEGGYAVSTDNDFLTNKYNQFMSTSDPDGTKWLPRGDDINQGTERGSIMNEIRAKLPLLSAAIKSATGMSSQQLNSNFELQQYMRALTNPGGDVQANKNIIKSLSKQFGTGSLSGEAGGMPGAGAPTAPAAGGSALDGLTKDQLMILRNTPKEQRAALLQQWRGGMQ